MELMPLDVSRYLDSEEVISEFLLACLEEDDPNVFIAALGHVAKARGMSEIAKATGLGRESLYKSLAPGAHPRHETVRKIVEALGLRFTLAPALPKDSPEQAESP